MILDDLTENKSKPRAAGKQPTAKRRERKPKPRTTVVPERAALNVTTPRVNAIYNELAQLTVEQFPNACSVLLRVFAELSVDHHIDARTLMSENDARQTPLAKRMKIVAGDLQKRGVIPAKLKKAVENVADGPSIIAPGMPTFNLYVHNPFVLPKPRELYATWDELAPFLEALWP